MWSISVRGYLWMAMVTCTPYRLNCSPAHDRIGLMLIYRCTVCCTVLVLRGTLDLSFGMPKDTWIPLVVRWLTHTWLPSSLGVLLGQGALHEMYAIPSLVWMTSGDNGGVLATYTLKLQRREKGWHTYLVELSTWLKLCRGLSRINRWEYHIVQAIA